MLRILIAKPMASTQCVQMPIQVQSLLSNKKTCSGKAHSELTEYDDVEKYLVSIVNSALACKTCKSVTACSGIVLYRKITQKTLIIRCNSTFLLWLPVVPYWCRLWSAGSGGGCHGSLARGCHVSQDGGCHGSRVGCCHAVGSSLVGCGDGGEPGGGFGPQGFWSPWFLVPMVNVVALSFGSSGGGHFAVAAAVVMTWLKCDPLGNVVML